MKRLAVVFLMSVVLFLTTPLDPALAATAIDLVGDQDQNPPSDCDGHGFVPEPEDPPGFDERQTGGEVGWTHTVPSLPMGAVLETATLRIAIVGLFDAHPGIDNQLFVDGVEIRGAFDGSSDCWNLYTFDIDTSFLNDGTLEVLIDASEPPGGVLEGWGGPDYAELEVSYTLAVPAAQPLGLGVLATLLLSVGVGAIRNHRRIPVETTPSWPRLLFASLRQPR